jgi:hypothetical protein
MVCGVRMEIIRPQFILDPDQDLRWSEKDTIYFLAERWLVTTTANSWYNYKPRSSTARQLVRQLLVSKKMPKFALMTDLTK